MRLSLQPMITTSTGMLNKFRTLPFGRQILLASLIPAISLMSCVLSLWPLQRQVAQIRDLTDKVAAEQQLTVFGNQPDAKAYADDFRLLRIYGSSLARTEAMITAVNICVFLVALLCTIAAAISIRRNFVHDLRTALDENLTHAGASGGEEVNALAQRLSRAAAETRLPHDELAEENRTARFRS